MNRLMSAKAPPLGLATANTPPALVPLVYDAVGGLGVVIAFYAPWLLALWPIRLLGCALARAYALKWLSETMVLQCRLELWTAVCRFDILQRLCLVHCATVALAWMPPVMLIYRRLLPVCANRPPLLLVLRVFQHDAQVQHLFD